MLICARECVGVFLSVHSIQAPVRNYIYVYGTEMCYVLCLLFFSFFNGDPTGFHSIFPSLKNLRIGHEQNKNCLIVHVRGLEFPSRNIYIYMWIDVFI